MAESSDIGEIRHHTSGEIANHYACQKLIKTWIQNPEYPSSQYIPLLHRELMNGVEEYQKKGFIPLAPGDYRITDVNTEGRSSNFFVPSTDVKPTMIEYTDALDGMLRAEISNPAQKLEQTIHDAAWAYYVFERIHPFLDGNGRVGRMILKRVMKGRGYKDIIFQPNEIYSGGKNEHLEAMEAVHDSGNLAHLELYLLDQMSKRYDNNPSDSTFQQITSAMEKKRQDIATQKARTDLGEIWSGFKGLHVYGVENPQDVAA